MHQCRHKIHHDNAFCLAGASFAVIALPCNILFCAISQILIHSRPYSFHIQCLNCLLNSPSKLNIASVNREIIAVINSFVTHINERVKLLSCQPAEQSNYSRSAYQQELKKEEGGRLCGGKLRVPSTHLLSDPVFRFYSALASRCTTQLATWFIGSKERCQGGLLHNRSIKSWAEQRFNSHMAITTVGGEEGEPFGLWENITGL